MSSASEIRSSQHILVMHLFWSGSEQTCVIFTVQKGVASQHAVIENQQKHLAAMTVCAAALGAGDSCA